MDKSKANAQAKAMDLYYRVVGMAVQLENNGLAAEAKLWQKAAELLAPAVAAEIEKVQSARKDRIANWNSHMRPEVLELTQKLDRVAQLEAENQALRAAKK